MSKLYDYYLLLKSQEQDDQDTLYLFKSGIFFIFLDQDAKKASNILNLKVTNLTETIVKCGFPVNSLNKYSMLLKQANYNLKIIDIKEQNSYHINDYNMNQKVQSLIDEIDNISPDSLSIKEAYTFIDHIKCIAKEIKDYHIISV